MNQHESGMHTSSRGFMSIWALQSMEENTCKHNMRGIQGMYS